MATATKKKAGKRTTNKSAAIRAYLAANPDAGPTAVAAALKAKGIAISPAHVSNVKAVAAKKAGKSQSAAASNGAVHAKRGRRGRKAAAGGDSVSLSLLIEARKFAAQVGGVDRAVGLLQSLAKLQQN